MRVYRGRSVSKNLVGLGLLVAVLLGACAEPTDSSGEFELSLDPETSFAVVGEFHLTPVGSFESVRDFSFDRGTSRMRAPLPAGDYVLTLNAAARLTCPEDEVVEGNPVTPAPRLVSTWPQRVSITAGEVTTAHIGLGSPPAARALRPASEPALAGPASPCSGPADEVARQVISRR